MLCLSNDGEIPDYYENFVKKSKTAIYSQDFYKIVHCWYERLNEHNYYAGT